MCGKESREVPEARHRAIARQLVRAIVSELGKRGAAVVTAGVALDNAAARSFEMADIIEGTGWQIRHLLRDGGSYYVAVLE